MKINSHCFGSVGFFRSVAAVIPLACLGLGVLGCSRAPGPVVHFVEGRVFFDGQPLVKAKIGFSPADGGGLAAFGETDGSGDFLLTSAGAGTRGRGAVAGDYVVTIRKYLDPLSDLGEMPDPDQEAQAFARWQADADRLRALPLESSIPEVYGNEKSSPLRATVKPGRNAFRFELSKKIDEQKLDQPE